MITVVSSHVQPDRKFESKEVVQFSEGTLTLTSHFAKERGSLI